MTAQISVSIEVIQGLCPGINNGELSVQIAGGQAPYSIQWSTGATTQDVINLGAGTYSVLVTDDLGDSDEASITLTNPDELTLSFDPSFCQVPYVVTAVGTGGTPPYQFKWEHTQDGATVSFLEPGTYCVTMTDATAGNACGIQDCITIPGIPENLNVAVQADDLTCADANDGQLEAFPTGGLAPYQYLWSNGAVTKSISPLAPGDYQVTVTDQMDCTATASGTVSDQSPLIIDLAASDPLCQEDFNGTIVATVQGGTPPYSFSWNTGATTTILTNIGRGSYSLTVTDDNGCATEASIQLNPQSNISGIISATPESCEAENDGQISIQVSNGVPPYQFVWSDGVTGFAARASLAPGVYSITVSDDLGCQVVLSETVQAAPALAISTNGTDISTCNGSNGVASVTVTQGVPPYFYTWSTGETTSSIENLTDGTYTVTVTDGNGCRKEGVVTIQMPPSLTISLNGTPLICPGTQSGQVNLSIDTGNPPYVILWNNGATGMTIDNLTDGTYSLTVTDDMSCEATASFDISAASEMDISFSGNLNVCGSGNLGSATATVSNGTGPYNYLWSNGATTSSIDNLTEGIYTLTITDNLGCTKESAVTIKIVDDLSLQIDPSPISCADAQDGALMANPSGGDAPYTYLWNTGGQTAALDQLASGDYSVTVTDQNGCTITSAISLSAPHPLTAEITSLPTNCSDSQDGQVAITTIGGGTTPYEVHWNTGDQGLKVDNLASGDYEATITDANQCSIVKNVTVNAPSPISVSVDVADLICGGDENGIIEANVSGGNPPYQYDWGNGFVNEATLEGLSGGTYSLTVVDNQGCSASVENIQVSEPMALALNFAVTDIVCSNDPIGAIQVAVFGGEGPYEVLWSNGETNALNENIAAGIYQVTVTDANECQVVGEATVQQTAGFDLSLTIDEIDCFNSNDGALSANIQGGAMPFTFIWSNGATTSGINQLEPGTYSVTVTDNNNCTAEAQYTLVEPNAMSLQFKTLETSCFGEQDGEAMLTVTNGTQPYNIIWSNGTNGATITNVAGGTYSVTVTDANQCERVGSVEVPQPDELVLDITQIQGTCEGASSGILLATPSGGNPPYAIQWNIGQNTTQISNLTAGTYTVTLTDDYGCALSESFTLDEFESPSCNINIDQNVTQGNNGQLTVEVLGGQGPYQYDWNTGEQTQTITNLTSGSYTVTVTDENGCQTNCSIALIEMSGLGDLVWEDINKNGLQDVGEPGVPGITVKLKDSQGNIIRETITDQEGQYEFLGLAPGTYSTMVDLPQEYSFTLVNQGGVDDQDSDADLSTNGMTQVVTLQPGEINPTLDFGIYKTSLQRIPGVRCACLDNAVDEETGYFSETVEIISYPGEYWQITSVSNAYQINSADPPSAPTPINIPTPLTEVEHGVYRLDFIIVDGRTFNVSVSNGIDELNISYTCAYPKINPVPIPSPICISDDPVQIEVNPSEMGIVEYLMDGESFDGAINPQALGLGNHTIEVQLTPDSDGGCFAVELLTFEVTMDCFAKIGDYVWLDENRNGIQDNGESGLPNINVTITSPDDPDFSETTKTDVNGAYLFMVPPNQSYKLTFLAPSDFLPTSRYAGVDAGKDSDLDPNTGMTEFITLTDFEVNRTIDAGFYNICENATDPGEIGYSQSICGSGNIPDPIVSLEPGSGGQGELEYLWMYSTTPGAFDPTTWNPVPDSNSPDYAPGPIYEKTYFARCVKRVGCPNFIESNIIVIDIEDQAIARIAHPEVLCSHEALTFNAVDYGPGAIIEWSFGVGATPQIATGPSVDVTFSSFGLFRVNLSVTENGCTATREKVISVVNNPSTCLNALAIDLQPIEQEQVLVSWTTNRNAGYLYDIQHSKDGKLFETIGTTTAPHSSSLATDHFEYLDEAPKQGNNFYRVKIRDDQDNSTYSEVEKVLLTKQSRFMVVYPNPFKDEIHLEVFNANKRSVTLELINPQGMVLQTINLGEGNHTEQLDLSQLAVGPYFIKASYDELTVKVVKILKR